MQAVMQHVLPGFACRNPIDRMIGSKSLRARVCKTVSRLLQSQSNNGYAACFSPHTGLPLVTSHLRQPRNKFTDTRCMVFRMVYTKTQANNFRTLRYIRFCSAKASAKSDFARQRPSQNPNRIILGCHTALNCVQVSKNSAADLLPAAQIAFKKRKYRFQNLLRYSCPARPAVFGYRA